VDVRFPTDISYGVSGGPEFKTDIVMSGNGHEQRNINWPYARNRYNVAHGIKNKQQLDHLISFFRARRGRGIGFRFKDWIDYLANNQEIGYGDGSTKQFQLKKEYSSGDTKYTRIITKPVKDTVKIYFNKILQEKNYNINYSKGLVDFIVPPLKNVSITADFEFDVPVRFDTDNLSASIDDYGSYSWNNIPLIEIML
jgi:uncharacterized protein (TIGR02217 family)